MYCSNWNTDHLQILCLNFCDPGVSEELISPAPPMHPSGIENHRFVSETYLQSVDTLKLYMDGPILYVDHTICEARYIQWVICKTTVVTWTCSKIEQTHSRPNCNVELLSEQQITIKSLLKLTTACKSDYEFILKLDRLKGVIGIVWFPAYPLRTN